MIENAFNTEKIRAAIVADTDNSQWQRLLNLGYNEWQKPERRGWQYADMIDWAAQTYGEVVKFLILIGKYNQQVCNGGHIQYFDNGYADGTGGCFSDHDPDITLHKEMVQRFEQLGLRQTPIGAQVHDVISGFRIETATEDEFCCDDEEEGRSRDDGYRDGDVLNTGELDQLDERYFKISDEFCTFMEEYAARWIATGANPITVDSTAALPASAEPIIRPRVKLTGQDGNAFAILGLVSRALQKAGASEQTIDAFKREATSADYDHLLATAMKYCEVE